MSKMIGIDLGTTNSCMSVFVGGSTSKIVKLENGKTTMPSCVMWLGGDNWVVGEEAYKNRFKENCCYSIKSHMGENYSHTFKYQGETVTKTAVEISAMILKEMIRRASYMYPDLKDVTITVPAEFESMAREETKKAGTLANLNVVSMINEPTSAALGYNFEGEKTVLVYDLGGGTLDVSIVQLEKFKKNTEEVSFDLLGISLPQEGNDKVEDEARSYNVLVSEGDRHLGGDDIDKEWYRIIIKKNNAILGLHGEKSLNFVIPEKEKERILLSLENYKKIFKGEVSTNIEIKVQGTDLVLSTNEEDLKEATKAIYNKSKLCINRAIGSSRVNRAKIKDIVLVGGSTKSKFIQDFISEDFPDCKISMELNPDEAVAAGASIQTAITLGKTNTSIMDVSPYTVSVGVITTNADGTQIGGRTSPIVKKNTVLPVMVTQTFTVNDKGTNLQVPVYLGESSLAEDCQLLANIILERESKDSLAELCAVVDTNGILRLTVRSDGKEKIVEIGNLLGLEAKKKNNTKFGSFASRWKAQLIANGVSIEGKLKEALDKFSETGDKEAKLYIQKALNKVKRELVEEKTQIFQREEVDEVNTMLKKNMVFEYASEDKTVVIKEVNIQNDEVVVSVNQLSKDNAGYMEVTETEFYDKYPEIKKCLLTKSKRTKICKLVKNKE